MNLMIASDIHGSAFYCKKLIDEYNRIKPERLVLLGDILYHGPRNALPLEYDPPAVIKMFNEIESELLCVRGNCDCEVDQMVLSFPMLADYSVLFYKGRMIFVSHGHIYSKDNMPKLHSGDILLTGHTHIPACEEVGENMYLNPGSVSIPKEGSQNSYMMLDDDGFKWYNLNGECYRQLSL